MLFISPSAHGVGIRKVVYVHSFAATSVQVSSGRPMPECTVCMRVAFAAVPLVNRLDFIFWVYSVLSAGLQAFWLSGLCSNLFQCVALWGFAASPW